MKAGGISPLRVLVPVLVAAAVISGLALLLNETLAVRAHEASRRHGSSDGGGQLPPRFVLVSQGPHHLQRPRRRPCRPRAARTSRSSSWTIAAACCARSRPRAPRSEKVDAGTSTDAVLRGFDPDDVAAPSHYERPGRRRDRSSRREGTARRRRLRALDRRAARVPRPAGTGRHRVRARRSAAPRTARRLRSRRSSSSCWRSRSRCASSARRSLAVPALQGVGGDLPVLHGARVREHARHPGRHIGDGQRAWSILGDLPRRRRLADLANTALSEAAGWWLAARRPSAGSSGAARRTRCSAAPPVWSARRSSSCTRRGAARSRRTPARSECASA